MCTAVDRVYGLPPPSFTGILFGKLMIGLLKFGGDFRQRAFIQRRFHRALGPQITKLCEPTLLQALEKVKEGRIEGGSGNGYFSITT
jgi:hypothetical protein